MRQRSGIFAIALLTVAWLAGGAQAAVITRALEFPPPEILRGETTCTVRIEDLPVFAEPGEPLLPIHTFRFILPQSEGVPDVAALMSEEQEIEIDLPLPVPTRSSCSSGQAAVYSRLP